LKKKQKKIENKERKKPDLNNRYHWHEQVATQDLFFLPLLLVFSFFSSGAGHPLKELTKKKVSVRENERKRKRN
jgi:hypothetical protein